MFLEVKKMGWWEEPAEYCTNCGYQIPRGDLRIQIIVKGLILIPKAIIGQIIGIFLAPFTPAHMQRNAFHQMYSMVSSIANALEVKCPRCGTTSQWMRVGQ
jgi:ribosomal protein L37E